MSPMSGNMNKISHEEAVASNIKPHLQSPYGFQEYPKVVGETKPTEAEAKEAERTKIPFVPKPIIARNPDEASRYASTGSPALAVGPDPARLNDPAYRHDPAYQGRVPRQGDTEYPKQPGLTKPWDADADQTGKTRVLVVTEAEAARLRTIANYDPAHGPRVLTDTEADQTGRTTTGESASSPYPTAQQPLTGGYPKQIGVTKPTDAEAAAAKNTGIAFVPKPVIAANAAEEEKLLASGSVELQAPAAPQPSKGAAWNTGTAAPAKKTA